MFYRHLLSRGVSCYMLDGKNEVQGVGIGPQEVLDALSGASCVPVAGSVCWGRIKRLGPEFDAEAPYGIQWGEPWEKARSVVNGREMVVREDLNLC